MSEDIEVHQLTSLSVSGDGAAFRVGVADGAARSIALVFPIEALKALMLSLFRVGDTALKRVMKDDSARVVLPMESVHIQPVPGTDHRILVLRSPDGPVAGFSPWNFPINQAVRKISGALAAGCSIIIKAPEETPASCPLRALCGLGKRPKKQCSSMRRPSAFGTRGGLIHLVFLLLPSAPFLRFEKSCEPS